MADKIPIVVEDTNVEVLARIVKSISKKYGCEVNIDFANGNRKFELNCEKEYVPVIEEEIRDIFKK